MLNQIWDLLAGYGLETEEIAAGIQSLFAIVETTDAAGNTVTTYTGKLAALADFPLIGIILKAFASFTPPVD